MTLCTRNEGDILEAQLTFHLDQGVDHVIVTDNLSTDSTQEILASFATRGFVTALREGADTNDQDLWVTRMAQMAANMGATWVINSDTDEFLFATDGSSLGEFFSRWHWANTFIVPRHDFVCVEDMVGPFWEAMIYRKAVSTNALGVPLPPKTVHRASRRVVVRQGKHRVDGFPERRSWSRGLEILHFPMRSRSQYFDKIRTGGQAYSNNTRFSPRTGNAWRKQYEELNRTGTIAFFDANILSVTDVSTGLELGLLVEDTRLRAELERLAKS
jgi:hypothetical protein